MRNRTLSQRAGPLVTLDFLLVIGCYVLATYQLLGSGASTYLLYENGLTADVFTAGAVLILMYFQGLYAARHRRVGLDLALRLMTALGMAFLLEAGVFYLKNDLALPLSAMAAGSALTLGVLLGSRFIYYGLLSGSFGPDRILLVGATPLNRAIAERIQGNPEFGFTVAGFLDDRLQPGTVLEGGSVLGPVSALPEVHRELACHRAITDLPPDALPPHLIDTCTTPGLLERPNALYELLFSRVCPLRPADLLFGAELAPARSKVVLQTLYANLLGLAALIALLPVILIIAALIRIRSGSPVFDTQSMVGWNLTPFTRFRFRCHQVVKTDAGECLQVTPLGRWLQRLRLYRVPELLNVMRGEMALVGPPPLRAEFADALLKAVPYFRLAYAVKPGLVSWSALNDTSDAVTALEYDLYYIKAMSPSFDCSIFLQAFSAPPSQPEAEAVNP